MKIVIFPYAKQMRNGKPHPKNYPWWSELCLILLRMGHEIIQVGVDGENQLVSDFRKNLTVQQLENLVLETDFWIGVDSFGQHLGWSLGKKGIAIFGQSDPNIFGHEENINLLKDRKYLREKQFWWWEQAEHNLDAFVRPEVVVAAIKKHFG